jgi:hypothetical protein
MRLDVCGSMGGAVFLGGGLEKWCGVLRGGVGVTTPDQNRPIFVDGQPSRLDNFGFQVLDVVISETVLPLQGAISHTSMALEKVQDGIEPLVKIHHKPLRARVIGWACGHLS